MRDDLRRRPPSSVRAPGAGPVSVRAPDTDLPETQPVSGSYSPRFTASGGPPPYGSRITVTYTPLISHALESSVPTVEDLDPTRQLTVDGNLLECWSWADHPEIYSGRHKTTGLNVQVVCTQTGTLGWVSPPRTGESETPKSCATLSCSTFPPPTWHLE